jgi:hypothetical protein
MQVTPVRTRLSFAPLNWVDVEVRIYPSGDWDTLCGEDVLESRAWTVQERLLSPRYVCLYRNRIFWACNALHVVDLDPYNGQVDGENPLVDSWTTVFEEGDKSRGRDYGCLAYWTNMVMIYSAANLTRDSDKLAAIAGLAKYMQHNIWKSLNVEYHAGLWSFGFVRQLLWFGLYARRHSTYTAPTWPWASITGDLCE